MAPSGWLLTPGPYHLQAIDRLRLDPKGPGRPKALGMESSVGTEYVAFKTPLPLEGKVRTRLAHVVMVCSRAGHCEGP